MPTTLVIGAGVVGLAVARRLALAGDEVIVAEALGAIGSGISSRNSEVIHGGMYYPSKSLRAQHCVRGRRLLYEFGATRHVPFRKYGKLIVAVDQKEHAKIESIYEQGRVNEVEGLSILSRAQARKLEPALECVGAIHSSETGIIDSHAFMLALQGELEDHGGAVAFKTYVHRLSFVTSLAGQKWRAHFISGDAVDFDKVVNCAGLGAQAVAHATEGYPPELVPRRHLAKGNYFSFSGKPVFSRLIYPAPVDGGLGTHVTLDLSGKMKFGPDVQWIEQEVYTVDASRVLHFYEAIRRYWPGLPDGTLVPDYAGIRPKISGQGEPARDFVIAGPQEHRLLGHVALFGIESPGLTASLSLAEAVHDLLDDAS